MHRRSKEDVQWQQVKREVDLRDGHACRCCAILKPSEVAQTEKLNNPVWMFQQIDHAHVLPVGNNLDVAYDPANVYCMCRYHHSSLDNLINPLTHNSMTQNEQWYWWVRVRFRKTWDYDESIDYEDLYKRMSEQNTGQARKNVMDWW